MGRAVRSLLSRSRPVRRPTTSRGSWNCRTSSGRRATSSPTPSLRTNVWTPSPRSWERWELGGWQSYRWVSSHCTIVLSKTLLRSPCVSTLQMNSLLSWSRGLCLLLFACSYWDERMCLLMLSTDSIYLSEAAGTFFLSLINIKG